MLSTQVTLDIDKYNEEAKNYDDTKKEILDKCDQYLLNLKNTSSDEETCSELEQI